MSNPNIKQRLSETLARIAEAAARVARPCDAVRLVAVSKTVDVDAIAAAYEAGQRRFGENRVQELARKAAALPGDCEWHLIGHLQKNKARVAVQTADWIHSVDSSELLERLDRLAGEEGRRPRVLLQVNVTGEESKSGFAPAEVLAAAEQAVQCENLDCRGLMTMAEFAVDEAALRATFGALRELRDQAAARCGRELPELSMGMSGDFEAAIAEGATLVRIGTAVFGPRL